MKKLKKGDIARQIDSLYKSHIVAVSVRYDIWLPAFERKINPTAIMNATDPEFID